MAHSNKELRALVAYSLAASIDGDDIVAAELLDTDDDHVGPMGGKQRRLLVVTDAGDVALVVVYADEKIEAMADALIAERDEAAERRARRLDRLA